jgi:hypothetical protein
MAKGPKGEKRPADLNRRAFDIVKIASGESEANAPESAAAELGRRGGLKGGRARATALSAERRSEIAKAAAKSRWQK